MGKQCSVLKLDDIAAATPYEDNSLSLFHNTYLQGASFQTLSNDMIQYDTDKEL